MQYKLKVSLPKEGYVESYLRNKGINDIEAFLAPNKRVLYDPALLDNIFEGASLLLKHVENRSKIYIQPDCDVDGYTSSAILYQYIKELDPEVELFFSIHEGKAHGLSDKIDWLEDQNFDLVILPDSSSFDLEEHARLKECGIDVLVIDHHDAECYSPHAIVINNQLSEKYPNKALCGAGVVYKFCQYLDAMIGRFSADNYLDLVALGTIADVMSLAELENRYIIEKGLGDIRNGAFKALIEKQSYSMGGKVNPTTIAWYVAPLINAIVRAGTIEEKEMMFIAFVDPYRELPSTKRGHNPGDTELACDQLARVTTNVRNRQNKLKEKAIEVIEYHIQKNDLLRHKILVVALDEDEMQQVDSNLTGLIAMYFTNKYKRPVLLGRKTTEDTIDDPQIIKGSIRSDDAFGFGGLKDLLEETKYFEFVAGHQNAAGFGLAEKELNSFLDYTNDYLADFDFNQSTYMVDYIFDSSEDVTSFILEMAPLIRVWGQGVEEPKIIVENVSIHINDVSFIGTNKDTIKFAYNGVTYIKFKDESLKHQLQENEWSTLDIYGKMNLNEWAGRVTPQLMIQDYNIRSNKDDF